MKIIIKLCHTDLNDAILRLLFAEQAVSRFRQPQTVNGNRNGIIIVDISEDDDGTETYCSVSDQHRFRRVNFRLMLQYENEPLVFEKSRQLHVLQSNASDGHLLFRFHASELTRGNVSV